MTPSTYRVSGCETKPRVVPKRVVHLIHIHNFASHVTGPKQTVNVFAHLNSSNQFKMYFLNLSVTACFIWFLHFPSVHVMCLCSTLFPVLTQMFYRCRGKICQGKLLPQSKFVFCDWKINISSGL